MMFLSKIKLVNFKNIATADIEFSPKINCICGNNGEGKTNLLDAIYYLSMTKSFLSSSDKYTYMHGTDAVSLSGAYNLGSEGVENVLIKLSVDGGKTIRRNSKLCKRASELIGNFPVAVVSPSDISLVNDSGEERRRFLNMMLSQTDGEYLRRLMNYNKILRQRNALLKQDRPSEILLDTLSAQIAPDGDYIMACRREAVARISEYAMRYYDMIADSKEEISMRYVSDVMDVPMLEELGKVRQRDVVMKYTTVGIQRDELEFFMNGHPLKKCASQGQQKSFLVAVKMAQYELMKEIYGKEPILLLDDVFDKLDKNRVASLIEMVLKDSFGQVFITDSDKRRTEEIVKSVTICGKYFNVTAGAFEEIV